MRSAEVCCDGENSPRFCNRLVIGNGDQRIKSEFEEINTLNEPIVEQVENGANLIRDKIQHPLKKLSGALGGWLKQRIDGRLAATSSTSTNNEFFGARQRFRAV